MVLCSEFYFLSNGNILLENILIKMNFFGTKLDTQSDICNYKVASLQISLLVLCFYFFKNRTLECLTGKPIILSDVQTSREKLNFYFLKRYLITSLLRFCYIKQELWFRLHRPLLSHIKVLSNKPIYLPSTSTPFILYFHK